MTESEVDAILAEAELIPVMKAPLADLKKLRARCLEAGLPVAMGCPDGKSCGTSTHLLVREVDIPQVAALLRSDWQAMLAREGTGAVIGPSAPVGDDEELPCPACGTQAALVAGACSDCGLVLE
jgi:hypothetical protein